MNLDPFKELIWDSITRVVLQKIVAKLPLLGWGPVGFIFKFFLFKLSDLIFLQVQLTADLLQIKIKNQELEKQYRVASFQLRRVALTEGVDSEAFTKARNEYQNKLLDLIRFDV